MKAGGIRPKALIPGCGKGYGMSIFSFPFLS